MALHRSDKAAVGLHLTARNEPWQPWRRIVTTAACHFKIGVLYQCSQSMRETARDQPRWPDILGTRGNAPCASSSKFPQASSRTPGTALLPPQGGASSVPWH